LAEMAVQLRALVAQFKLDAKAAGSAPVAAASAKAMWATAGK